jgi:hypothetical protein
MEKEIEYQVSYDVISTIKYTGEKSPGEYHFAIYRAYPELIFDNTRDNAIVTFDEEGYLEIDEEGSITDEEIDAIEKMMTEIISLK